MALALAVPATGAEVMAPVEVGGITVPPAGDLRDGEGRFEFHPKALLGGGWNSLPEVPPAPDSGSDVYARGLVGLLVRYHPRPGLDANADVEIGGLAYHQNTNLDTDAGMLRAGFERIAPGLMWSGDAVWRRSEETLLTTGEQVAQDHSRVRTRIGHDSTLWWEDASLAVSQLDYLQATNTFSAEQGDHTTGDLGLRVGIAEGDDRCFLGARSQLVYYSDEGRFNDCAALTATAGCVLRASARSNLHLEAGMEVRDYTDDYLGDATNDDRQVLAPWWDLGGAWSWCEGDRMGARLYSDLADSLTSNATWSIGGELSAHTEPSRRLALEAVVDLAEARDGGITQESAVLQRRILQGSLSGQYALAEGLATRLRATAVRVQEQAGGGYDRLLVSLDLAYVY